MIGRFQSYMWTIVAGLSIGIGQSLLTRYQRDILPADLASGWPDALPFLVIIAVLVIGGTPFPKRGEIVARLSGDEFAVVEDHGGDDGLAQAHGALADRLAVAADATGLPVSVSTGVATATAGQSLSEVLSAAVMSSYVPRELTPIYILVWRLTLSYFTLAFGFLVFSSWVRQGLKGVEDPALVEPAG